jgi:pimeloyl-ACP methyl ester carboxylesterase
MRTRPHTDSAMERADRLARALHEGLPVTERRLDLAGVSTSVLEGGDGPPVVLLHGVGMFAEMWGGVIPHLVASHRIVAPDLPGQGRSEVRAGTRLDAPSMVAWLGELIAQTCSEPPTLVGASLGGSIAAHFGVEHSDRISRIVLVASGSLGLFRPAAPGALFALARYMRRPTASAFDRFFRYALHDPEHVSPQTGESLARWRPYHIDRTKQPSVRKANAQLLRRIGMRRIPAERLGRITVPVALIWGRNDRIMRFRIAERASARFGWPLYPIDNCGHFTYEQFGAFLEAFRAAMGKGSRSPGRG